jgi:hypothetical protein
MDVTQITAASNEMLTLDSLSSFESSDVTLLAGENTTYQCGSPCGDDTTMYFA